jgi:translation initiation factor IF-3
MHKKDQGPNANDSIKSDPVRVITEDGEMLGVLRLKEAIEKAQSMGLDLVEVSPNAKPPVCKVMDLGKFMYEQQKKKKEAKKKQKVVHLKEIKLRVNIDPHDLEYRLKNARKFLENGDKVKFSLRFRGREVTHSEIAKEKFIEIIENLEDVARIDSQPKMENGQLTMILGPATK